MEKWRSKPKSLNKIEIETNLTDEKKKNKRWTFGGLFKKNLKPDVLTENKYINDNVSKISKSNKNKSLINYKRDKIKDKESIKIYNGTKINRNVNNENISSDSTLNNINRRHVKLSRIHYSKRYKYHNNADNNSSSDEEYSNYYKSNNSLTKIIQSNDDIQKYECNKKSRGARTERYFKRLYREDLNSIFDAHLSNNKRKYSSDTLIPSTTKMVTKTVGISNARQNHIILQDKKLTNFKSSSLQNDKKLQQICINQNKLLEENIYVNINPYRITKPPEPPPRSTSMRLSFQGSDIDDEMSFKRSGKFYHNINYSSLDGFYRNKNKLKMENNSDYDDDNINAEENPIIPKISKNKSVGKESKNLKEALIELEKIYNSLQLNDEDLLDRAEQRSMEEYRDKITTAVKGSIRSSSERSSSSRGLDCRDKSFDRCQEDDNRLKDDMAYRRMHVNERPSSLDINQTSLSKISYLNVSPNLSSNHFNYLPENYSHYFKSTRYRATPDLTRDDVLYRTINHANNTLKITDPQPPFGIPLGPVTSAPQTDYLHREPTKTSNRSLYIPQSEPNVITDDLAFRSLRKDFTKDKFNHKNKQIFNKKRPVRSLSADLCKIINKRNDNQFTWYRSYTDNDDNDDNDDDDDNNNKIKSLFNNTKQMDNNDNPRTNIYQSKIQVFIPQQNINADKERENEEERLRNDLKNNLNSEILNDQLSEYKQLCQELESLIKKTSEKVKINYRKNSKFQDELSPHANTNDDDDLCFSPSFDDLIGEKKLTIKHLNNDVNDVPYKSIIDENIDRDIKCNGNNISNNNKLVGKDNVKSTCQIDNNVSTYEGEEIENKLPVIIHETLYKLHLLCYY